MTIPPDVLTPNSGGITPSCGVGIPTFAPGHVSLHLRLYRQGREWKIVKNWKKYHTESNDVCIVSVKEGEILSLTCLFPGCFFFYSSGWNTDAFLIGIFPSFQAKSHIIEGWNSMEHNIDEWTHWKERAIRYHACERPELAGFGKTESPGLIEMGTVFETICIRRIWTLYSRCQDYFPLGGSSVMFGLGKWRSWFTLHQTTKEKYWLGIEFLDPKKACLR